MNPVTPMPASRTPHVARGVPDPARRTQDAAPDTALGTWHEGPHQERVSRNEERR